MAKTTAQPQQETTQYQQKQCGIVMPIASMTHIREEYTKRHWAEIYDIICEAC